MKLLETYGRELPTKVYFVYTCIFKKKELNINVHVYCKTSNRVVFPCRIESSEFSVETTKTDSNLTSCIVFLIKDKNPATKA